MIFLKIKILVLLFFVNLKSLERLFYYYFGVIRTGQHPEWLMYCVQISTSYFFEVAI